MNENASKHEPRGTSQEDGITLLGLLTVIAKHKWLVVGLPFCMAILAAIGGLTAPFVYTGTTKILPPQQSGSAAAQLSQLSGALGGLASLAGGPLGAAR